MTDWTPWHGGECPIKSPDTRVEYRMRNGRTYNGKVIHLSWEHIGHPGDIIAYRITEDHEPRETLTEQRDRLARELAEVEARIEAEKPKKMRAYWKHSWGGFASFPWTDATHYRDFPLIGGIPEGFVPVEGE